MLEALGIIQGEACATCRKRLRSLTHGGIKWMITFGLMVDLVGKESQLALLLLLPTCICNSCKALVLSKEF